MPMEGRPGCESEDVRVVQTVHVFPCMEYCTVPLSMTLSLRGISRVRMRCDHLGKELSR